MRKNLPKAIAPAATRLNEARNTVHTVAPVEIAASRQDPNSKIGPTISNQITESTGVGPSTSKEEIKADTPEALAIRRHVVAIKLAERFSLWSGAAGFIPMPFIDLAAIGGVQIQMLRRISRLYNIPFSENRGKALIASLIGSLIPGTSVIGAASIAKGVPLLGTAISAVAMPTLSAGATYAIGIAFIQHFDSGGTLLDFNPSKYRAFVKARIT